MLSSLQLQLCDVSDKAWGSKPIWKRRTDQQHADPAVHFDWHPHHRCKLMTITAKGTIGVCAAREPAACDMSSTGVLSYGSVGATSTFQNALTTCATTHARPAGHTAGSDPADVSTKMYANAVAGYYATRIDDNVGICAHDADVQLVWLWLQGIQDTLDSGLVGLRDALASGANESDALGVGELKLGVHDTTVSRARALVMCGWVVINDVSALNKRLAELESAGEHERAAAIAIFHQRIPRAIQSLTSGAKDRTDASRDALLSTAMSLAGYTPPTVSHAYYCAVLCMYALFFTDGDVLHHSTVRDVVHDNHCGSWCARYGWQSSVVLSVCCDQCCVSLLSLAPPPAPRAVLVERC